MKQKLKKLVPKKLTGRRGKNTDQSAAPPRITNETVAAHREEVLKGARKYIYPLQHSKRRVVAVTGSLVVAAILAFFVYSVVSLYRLQNSSTFIYRVTQVIPFPIAKVGSDFVAYENYLFELRHYKHFYETQQELDFNDEAGRQQLAEFKKRALDKVVNDAYIKRLAEQRGISVSAQNVDDQIALVRNQNRLGSSDQVLEDVLKDFWDWSLDDFKRSLQQELLAQKVVSALDEQTHREANDALAELRGGADFTKVAQKYSEDPATKEAGGKFGFAVDRTNRDLPAETTDALFRLNEGETSDIINVGYGLEIVKNIKKEGDKITAAHILFNFEDIKTYLTPLKERQPTRLYITP
jgi:hypothetical protein